MCGRVHLSHSAEELADRFDIADPLYGLRVPQYNVAPGASLPAIRERAGVRELVGLRWGLIPSWAREAKIGFRMINARAETVAEKPAFRVAYRQRRCIVPISGYFEWWRPAPKSRAKRAFRFAPADGRPFACAGLHERWTDDATGEAIESCTLLTTAASAGLEAIHHRMPVMLASNRIDDWLAAGPPPAPAEVIAWASVPPALDIFEVSTLVNNARNDEPECLERNPAPELADRLMQLRGWRSGFVAQADGPRARWSNPEDPPAPPLDPDAPDLAADLLAEMDRADVDITGIEGLPPREIAEAWIAWQG